MQGLTFNMEGPVVSGYWYNPKTGDSFTVRDCYFEDNQFMIVTTDGRSIAYNQMQNYIQSDKPIDVENKAKLRGSSAEYIPDSIKDMIETYSDQINEDAALDPDIRSMKPLYEGAPTPRPDVSQYIAQSNSKFAPSNNYYIIDRALSKVALPKIKIDINWGARKAPKEELCLLSNIMDVPVNDIVDWYISKFDLNALRDELHESIKHAITKEFSDNDNKEVKEVQKPVKTRKK